MWRLRFVPITVAAVTACAAGMAGPSLEVPPGPLPRPLHATTVTMRRDLLDRAEVWRDVATESLDLLQGPPGEDAPPFAARLACAFDFPDSPLGGTTPKFLCLVRSGDVVMVKYGRDNGEVYAEVAATRLFWALGFGADRVYPVRLLCSGCPAGDPFRVSRAEWHLGRPGRVETRLFDPAIIERPVEGRAIGVDGEGGWSWRELDEVADNAVGAPRAHVDALKLLAAFVQHVDSKPEQQAIVCPPGAITSDAQGHETCAAPRLVVKDLGSTFAAGHRFTYFSAPKMVLRSWRRVPIWRDPASCCAQLAASATGTLEHPLISEAGRRFLADRLMRLDDRQIRDLFTASRVELRNERVDGRRATVEDWVEVFRAKRAAIARHRCPS